MAKKEGKSKAKPTKKSVILDVNADGIVDEKDVELVKKEAAKTKSKKTVKSKSVFTKAKTDLFMTKTNRLGIRAYEVENACKEIFGDDCNVVWNKNHSKQYNLSHKKEIYPKNSTLRI